MKDKRLFGLIRYKETEDGDRLTQQSVRDTVHTGMALGGVGSLVIAWTLFNFMSNTLGQTVGVISVLVFLGSWGISSYLAYPTVKEKVEDAFRKHGEYYEG